MKSQVIAELLETLGRWDLRDFYGSVELKLEAGKVVLVKKIETLKPDELSDKPRWNRNADTTG